MRIFGPKLPVDRDEFEWLLASFKWLLESFEGLERHRATPLFTPTLDYFPASRLTGHARVEELFAQVKGHADMADWPSALIQGETARPTQVATYHHLVAEEGSPAPLGTFSLDAHDDAVVATISYNPDNLDDPATLVATLAHELAHYLVATAPAAPPGGWDLHEHVTDLAAVFLGFGIFMANNAKSFSGHTSFEGSGWASSLRGYLSEAALVTAIAISERLADRDPMAAARWLKPHLAADLKNATGYLARRHPDLAGDVMAIDLSDYAAEEEV